MMETLDTFENFASIKGIIVSIRHEYVYGREYNSFGSPGLEYIEDFLKYTENLDKIVFSYDPEVYREFQDKVQAILIFFSENPDHNPSVNRTDLLKDIMVSFKKNLGSLDKSKALALSYLRFIQLKVVGYNELYDVMELDKEQYLTAEELSVILRDKSREIVANEISLDNFVKVFRNLDFKTASGYEPSFHLAVRVAQNINKINEILTSIEIYSMLNTN